MLIKVALCMALCGVIVEGEDGYGAPPAWTAPPMQMTQAPNYHQTAPPPSDNYGGSNSGSMSNGWDTNAAALPASNSGDWGNNGAMSNNNGNYQNRHRSFNNRKVAGAPEQPQGPRFGQPTRNNFRPQQRQAPTNHQGGDVSDSSICLPMLTGINHRVAAAVRDCKSFCRSRGCGTGTCYPWFSTQEALCQCFTC